MLWEIEWRGVIIDIRNLDERLRFRLGRVKVRGLINEFKYYLGDRINRFW